jgi:hypothetical protein
MQTAPKARGRSIALYVRHHLSGRLTSKDQADVRRVATEVIERDAGAPLTPDEPPQLYVILEVAAQLLAIEPSTVLNMLRYPQFRRAWGWPRTWDGLTWRFRLDALQHPERYAALEPVEPPHNLPAWCLRVADVADMDVFPDLRRTSRRANT